MQKILQFVLSVSIILGLGLISCVPSKKVLSYEAKINKLIQDSTSLQNKLDSNNKRIQNLEVNRVAVQDEGFNKVDDIKELSPKSEITSEDQLIRLRELPEIIQLQKYSLNNIKTSILEALKFYTPDEFYVFIKYGNVYVSFEEKLLFEPGSDSIVPKGKEALKELALVLNNTEGINVMIEGHTDNNSINSLVFKDNWELSTAKATSIVRILTNDFGFDSNRITASGKAEFDPINTNETNEGGASNRRTEIIISTDLTEIFEILYSSTD